MASQKLFETGDDCIRIYSGIEEVDGDDKVCRPEIDFSAFVVARGCTDTARCVADNR